MLKKVIKAIKNPKLSLVFALNNKLFRILPDWVYLKIKYKLIMGRTLNLKNPKSFNEKLQWLKLYDRNPLYTKMVDKYEVRNLITDTIGNEYLIPLYGVYNSVTDIDFEKLPNSFVLKTTHDSGGIVICKSKANLDIMKAKATLKNSLNRNYYYVGREWPYKDVNPRIVCEEFIEENIKDYKFYCFNGEPVYLYVSQGLVNDHSLKVSFYDMEWNKAPFGREDYPTFNYDIPKPNLFEEMKEICRRLSKDMAFVRVDLYEVNNKVYFSELTLTPVSGFMPFTPEKYDYILGELITITK